MKRAPVAARLSATVAESLAATGARFLVGYDRADGSGWPQRLPDWPREENRFGRWRVVVSR